MMLKYTHAYVVLIVIIVSQGCTMSSILLVQFHLFQNTVKQVWSSSMATVTGVPEVSTRTMLSSQDSVTVVNVQQIQQMMMVQTVLLFVIFVSYLTVLLLPMYVITISIDD